MANQHESIRSNEQLDEALDEFERVWSPDTDYLSLFVADHCELLHPQALTELIRADIDRRYAADLDVDLAAYFKTFPELSTDFKLVSAIGYEDFRSRRSRNLPFSFQRWSWMPGIDHASWFVAIRESRPHSTSFNSQLSKAHLQVVAPNFEPGASNSSDRFSTYEDSTTLDPKIGERFGEFQLLAILGEGAFSKVFLATQLRLASRYVALKVVRRPLDEPTHLARLQHTGIVPLYSLHRIGPYSALCMPYFGSATLADWFRSSDVPSRDGQSLVGTIQSAQMRLTTIEANGGATSLNEQEVDKVRVWNAAGAQPLEKLRSLDSRHSILWIAERLAAALAHAHERGVIHGDLKPANILIRNDGEPALIDFNLSSNIEQQSTAWAGGTLPYMSPEQLRLLLGQAIRNDASSDVYSLGIILFELIENRLPFPPPLSQAESDIKAALDNRTILPTISSSTATAGLKSIVRKCLSFSPNDRYASAQSLYEDIEREISLQPLLHARESWIAGRIPKMVRRYPRLFSAGPITLVSLLVTGLAVSLTLMAWKRSSVLDVQAQLTRFQNDSKLLLSELVEPDLSRWDELLGQANGLTDKVLGKTSHLPANNRKELLETKWKWLNAEDRAAAKRDLAEFGITTVALTCSSVSKLTGPQREQLQQLLSLCSEITDSAELTTVLHQLGQLVESDEGAIDTRYESMMRDLEKRLDEVDTSSQSRMVELLQARTNVRNGQARQAMERLRSIDVHNTPAHLYWIVSGDAQAQLQQFESAIQSYGMAIAVAPKSVAAFVLRAEALRQFRMFKSAEESYRVAIELSPFRTSLYFRRAEVREHQGDIDGALEDLDAALDLEPQSNRLYFTRARLHQLAGHREESIKDFRNGMAASPKSVEDWVSRALAQVARYPDRAKADLQAALELDPRSIIVLQNLAHVESEHLHDTKSAMSALDRILELDPKNELARAGRSVLLARQGQVEECLRDLELLSSRQQKLPSTFYQMGCAHALMSERNAGSCEISVRLLAEALRRGYGAEIVADDDDLEAIRGQPSFKSLLEFAELSKTP
jgi:eukaryotic-like serine/threonine-protein kinase